MNRRKKPNDHTGEILTRSIIEGKYMLENNSTVRATAKFFNKSKTCIHVDLWKYLVEADYDLYLKVQDLLSFNKSQRHLRGGEATRQHFVKWRELHDQTGIV